MKKAAEIPAATKERVIAGHKPGVPAGVFHREGRPAPRGARAVAHGVPVVQPLPYAADDIAEANRIGAALCRQHAR